MEVVMEDALPLQFRAALDEASEILRAATAVHTGSRPSAASRRLTSLRPSGSGFLGLLFRPVLDRGIAVLGV
jgi:hypothetical protein